jgi:hypothetical protein
MIDEAVSGCGMHLQLRMAARQRGCDGDLNFLCAAGELFVGAECSKLCLRGNIFGPMPLVREVDHDDQ